MLIHAGTENNLIANYGTIINVYLLLELVHNPWWASFISRLQAFLFLWDFFFLLHEHDYLIQPLATICGQDVGQPVPERAQADNRGTPLIWIRALKRPNRRTPLIWIRALKRPPEKCWANSDDPGGFSRRGAGQKPATVCSTLQPHATACLHKLSPMLALPSPVWCWGDREGWIA